MTPETDGAGCGDDDAEREWLVDVRFRARPERLKLVRGMTMHAGVVCGCSPKVANDLVIAIDEACQNVIRHAYRDAEGDVILQIFRHTDRIVLLLHDFAPPVDVDKIRPRPLDDLRPGGLGTHFIREVMDEVAFLPARSGHGNVLRLVKRIE